MLLDLGCGGGRGTVYFALRGSYSLGVDVNRETLEKAKQLKEKCHALCDFVLADGRNLCFRDQSFENTFSFASMLSEKHRLWMERPDRKAILSEATRVTNVGGLVVFNFVHRYWSLRGLLGFLKHYWMWAREKMAQQRTELGDYVERIESSPVSFHAFTVREGRSLYPRNIVQLTVWKRNTGPFTDWFFIIGKKPVNDSPNKEGCADARSSAFF